MPDAHAQNTHYPISRYLNAQQAYAPSFTADGRQITFLANITGVPQVWQVALPTASGEAFWPDQLTFEADRVMSVWCSPTDQSRLIHARDIGGNENAQLHLLATDDGTEVCLTTGHTDAMHMFGEWSAKGDKYLFSANRRDPGLFDVYLQELGGEAQLVWQHEAPGFLIDMRFSPDEERAVVRRMSSSFHQDLFEINLPMRTARQLSPDTEDASYEAVCYAPDGKSLLISTNLDSEFVYIGRLDLETLVIERLVAPEWGVELMTCSPNGQYIAYVVNIGGASELHVLDLMTGEDRVAPELDASPGVVGVMDQRLTFSPGSGRLAFSFTSATRTSDIWIWHLATDEVEAVTRCSHGGLPTEAFVTPELVSYPTFDRSEDGAVRRIPAWFYPPIVADGEGAPAIVIVHGGPESQFRPYFNFLAQYFLHNGYAVLAPNVRGSSGYGKTYSHLDNVEKRMDSVADLAHAARWLAGHPDIDGHRLAVYGGSYGGFMVLSALTTYPELWAAGIDIVGISNFATFLENTSDYRRAHREAEYGSLEHDRDFLESIAPINHVGRITAPLMVIHGANDPRVPLSEAEQLVRALEARDVPVEFLVFDDEGHGLVKLKNKRVAYPAIVEFLDQHVGDTR